jgi:hypothetical protein
MDTARHSLILPLIRQNQQGCLKSNSDEAQRETDQSGKIWFANDL